MRRLRPFSSVTRWLLVVVGCAVLETAQPTKAAAAEAEPALLQAEPAASADSVERASSPRTADTLLIPAGSSRPVVEPGKAPGTSSWIVLLALCAAGAGWFWWRRRLGQPLVRGAQQRQIQIEESRPLGNRQYLVVAAVGEKKYLLGITPGSIQMLAPLDVKKEAVHESVA